MTLAARIGVSPEQWRGMTPRELHIWADAWVDEMKRRERETKVGIYNLAGLTRVMIWAKHPPQYEAVFPEKQEPMGDEEMYEAVRALNALFGGKEA